MGAGKEIKPQAARPNDDAEPENAFDLWLKRGLHALYDDIANEPIPEELLRLIQDDREKS